MIPAGRDLDALVAEKVMGFYVLPEKEIPGCDLGSTKLFCGKEPGIVPRWGHMDRVKRYSTEIAAAWEIVLKKGCFHLVRLVGGSFRCTFDDTRWAEGPSLWDDEVYESLPICVHEAIAETAPLAICLAALKAVGVEV
jgi:hypothetical protein